MLLKFVQYWFQYLSLNCYCEYIVYLVIMKSFQVTALKQFTASINTVLDSVNTLGLTTLNGKAASYI